MNAACALPVDPYLIAQIEDEMLLGRLFGYKVDKPHQITPNVTIWATKGASFASFSGPATRSNDKVWLPKWRRGNDCFELIALCEMLITCTGASVTVFCPDMPMQYASFADHPSRNEAIRYAMCKAAIAYLTSKAAA